MDCQLFKVTCLLIFLLPLNLLARPEYAARTRINNCSECHVSPAGGGIRTFFGKTYGAKGYELSPYAQQDLFHLNSKILFSKPEEKEQRGGLAVMAQLAAANIPLTKTDPDSREDKRWVIAYNVGGSSRSGLGPNWETYLFYSRKKRGKSWLPQHFMFGRIRNAFGLMDDNHRSLIRIQTASDWLHLDMGLLMSANPLATLHYDIGLFSGKTPVGGTDHELSEGGADDWAASFNIRWLPFKLPIIIGGSLKAGNKVIDPALKEKPIAYSGYILWVFDSLSSKFMGSMGAEISQATGWNSSANTSLERYINSDFLTAVADKESRGVIYVLKLNFTQYSQFVYRNEFLSLDMETTGDAYRRQGFELNYLLDAHLRIALRNERSTAGNLFEEAPDSRTDGKLTYMLLELAI